MPRSSYTHMGAKRLLPVNSNRTFVPCSKEKRIFRFDWASLDILLEINGTKDIAKHKQH